MSIKRKTVELREMQENHTGTIAAIRAGGELGRRIRDMGIITGSQITVCGRAPLKDPVAFRVLHTTLTLRNNEADYISVQILEK
ncbi:FeoA family protein [Desulfopila sp. IMCC35008]|uniref:FeoA family protein n=1 Tax=Desulfopila sp. IMCC35008 TaxID=2653858 RepID=UPI0013D1539C|nr:FeoA family protein [Desulfopila sp. IMCC35008]